MRKGTPNVNCKYKRSPLPAHLLIVICWTIAHACLVDLQALLVTASLKGDGPTNYILTNLGVHILPLAFPCTLAISDDDWTKLPAFLGQDGSLVK